MNTHIYTISPHILNNIQNIYPKQIKSVLSFSFLYSFLFYKNQIIILSWGMKTSKPLIKLFSLLFKIQYLEDGLYRSYNTGAQGDKTLSLIIDNISPYYNSNKNNDLDNLINSRENIITKKITLEATKCLEYIIKNKITKYNNNISSDFLYPNNSILIVDQTLGDESLKNGNLISDLDIMFIIKKIKERINNPKIFIKIHPETINGDKKSALKINNFLNFFIENDIILIKNNLNPIELMSQMNEIHVLTSQMGFEGILLGKKVFTYGEPFYSYYGLTINYQTIKPKTTLSVIELFTIFCLVYTKYYNENYSETNLLSHLKKLNKDKNE